MPNALLHAASDMDTYCSLLEDCGEGELVSRVHTLVAGVVQVYHRLQAVEEEEKGRKVEQEVEGRIKVKRPHG